MQKRNEYPIKSLGDKNYKNPDYSKDYFKEGGLVPGQNISDQRTKNVAEKHLKCVREAGKLTWKERSKIEDRKVE